MKKILVADDEAANRFLVTEILSVDNTYELYQAEDGQEALVKIKENQFDLIILDVSMPKLNGFEVLEVINDLPVKPKVILLTAKTQKDVLDRSKLFQVDRFVSKPFNPIELYVMVNELLK